MTVAILIAVAFSATAIYSTYTINRNLNIMSVHPFAVSNSVFKIQNTISDCRIRLNQILINLLSNAVKYTDEGGNIKLTMKEVPCKTQNMVRLQFTITDNGIGMSKEFMMKLFQPFEQEGNTGGGMGLGLAITKNLVSLANGTINVESKLGEGSTFIVELPFTLTGQETEPACNKKFDDLRVLVADDDQDICEYTTLILNRIGVKATWVLSGQEAVEATNRAYENGESYDVIFLDWVMPGVDGMEATRHIREAVGEETLIIIISAFNWSEIEQEARLGEPAHSSPSQSSSPPFITRSAV